MQRRSWRVCIVATNQSVKSIASAAKHLTSTLRFADDGVFCVSGKGVSIPNLPYIAKHRVNKKLTASQAWVEAIDVISKTYAPVDEMMLFVGPEYRLWSKLQAFCNYTIKDDSYGVYSLYTPIRYFREETHRQIPCDMDQIGWCSFAFNSPANNCEAILMHRHSARLISSYLKDLLTRAELLNAEWSWPDLFQECLGEIYQIPCYAAVPSFATKIDGDPVRFVEDIELPSKIRKDDVYLPKATKPQKEETRNGTGKSRLPGLTARLRGAQVYQGFDHGSQAVAGG